MDNSKVFQMPAYFGLLQAQRRDRGGTLSDDEFAVAYNFVNLRICDVDKVDAEARTMEQHLALAIVKLVLATA